VDERGSRFRARSRENPAVSPTPLVIQGAAARVDLASGYFTLPKASRPSAAGRSALRLDCGPLKRMPCPGTRRSLVKTSHSVRSPAASAKPKSRVTANLSFEGSGDLKPAALNGQGNLLVTASQPLKVAVIGPMLDLLATVIPNLLKTGSDRLEGTFAIKDGLLSTQDLSVGICPRLRVNASGTINLVTEETSFQANANLRGALLRKSHQASGTSSPLKEEDRSRR